MGDVRFCSATTRSTGLRRGGGDSSLPLPLFRVDDPTVTGEWFRIARGEVGVAGGGPPSSARAPFPSLPFPPPPSTCSSCCWSLALACFSRFRACCTRGSSSTAATLSFSPSSSRCFAFALSASLAWNASEFRSRTLFRAASFRLASAVPRDASALSASERSFSNSCFKVPVCDSLRCARASVSSACFCRASHRTSACLRSPCAASRHSRSVSTSSSSS
mmetsp:Transcript_15239/g.31342  ORF Transcript_15239/g.31342 Transcript_15239/m.31342 type:complete len:219 (-) Transcript_15239:394-1050(-)